MIDLWEKTRNKTTICFLFFSMFLLYVLGEWLPRTSQHSSSLSQLFPFQFLFYCNILLHYYQKVHCIKSLIWNIRHCFSKKKRKERNIRHIKSIQCINFRTKNVFLPTFNYIVKFRVDKFHDNVILIEFVLKNH